LMNSRLFIKSIDTFSQIYYQITAVMQGSREFYKIYAFPPLS
jgi:hypothetical protein